MDDKHTSITSLVFALIIILAICWLICVFGTYLICVCLGIDWLVRYGTAVFVALLTIKSVMVLLK